MYDKIQLCTDISNIVSVFGEQKQTEHYTIGYYRVGEFEFYDYYISEPAVFKNGIYIKKETLTPNEPVGIFIMTKAMEAEEYLSHRVS